jgi:molecular chaperone DnaK
MNTGAWSAPSGPGGAAERVTALTHKEPVLGIDLGTSNSAACVVIDNKPVMIDLRDPSDTRFGVRTLPSAVSFDDQGGSVVGHPAMARLLEDPKRTLFGTKRFIGRAYDSPAVQKMLPFFPYKVVPTQHGAIGVDIDGRVKSLSAISAYILKTIRERAELQLGFTVRKAVITVPAYYNDNQRDAVVQAGRMAGLEVERLLNEPTAAAIAYGLAREGTRHVVIYDLGGGTFDVSVMRVEHSTLTVLGTAGDTFLGGEDFDAAIVDLICERYQGKTQVALSRNAGALAKVKEAAELSKRRLSVRDTTLVSCKDVVRMDRKLDMLEMPLTRQDIEKRVSPLVDRTLAICEQAMKAAGLKPSDIADVILVGGQSQMPYVRQRVEEYFGKRPRCELNPDEVVSLGAALLPQISASNVRFHDVLPMTVGIAVNGKFVPVIERNTRVPYRRRVRFSVPLKDFKGSKLELYQGDSNEVHKNERLGALMLDTVHPGQQDPVPISVLFGVTPECLLSVSVTNEETGQTQGALLRTAEST